MDGKIVALRLTDNPKILEVLRERGALRPDPNNEEKETYWAMFNGRPFGFCAGKVISLPENVATCLRNLQPLMGGTPTKRKNALGEDYVYRSSYDAQWTPVLDVVESWGVGDEAPSVKALRKTQCGVCEKSFASVRELAAHLNEHIDDEQGTPAISKSNGKSHLLGAPK